MGNIWEIINELDKMVEKSKEAWEIPVGAVVVDTLGNIISSGYNDRQGKNNVLGHAEINAIVNAEKKIKDWRLDGYILYVSLEPCDMCNAIIKESRIDKVYYIVDNKRTKNFIKINKEQLIDDAISEYKEKYKKYIVDFFKEKR